MEPCDDSPEMAAVVPWALGPKACIRGISSFQFCDFWFSYFADLSGCQLKAIFQALLVGQVVLPTRLHVFPFWDLGDVLGILGSMNCSPLRGRCYSPSFSDLLWVSNRHPLDLMVSQSQDLLKCFISGVTCNSTWHLPYH